MPCIYCKDGQLRRKKMKERAAKLIAMGINPRGLKFMKLMYR